METNQQPESDEVKLRERLEELLRQAGVLAEVTKAPANLPRVTTPRPALPSHETFLPGSILTTLFRNPKTGRTVSFKREELGELDGMTTNYLLTYYQSQSLFTPDDATRLRSSIELHSRRYSQLLRNSDWRGQVFGYEIAKEEAILRSLIQLRLLVECVQILTPPLMTVKRIGDEEFDLIDNLHGFIRLLTLALWQRLATEGSDLQAYGALSLCIAGLAAKPDDGLALLESGYAAANGNADAFKKWFEKGGGKAMERVETMLQPADKIGLDEIFGMFTRHTLDLGLQPVTIEFVAPGIADARDDLVKHGSRAIPTPAAAGRRSFPRNSRKSRGNTTWISPRAPPIPASARKTSPPFSRNSMQWSAWSR